MKMQKSIKCKLQKFVNPLMTFYQSRTRFRILLRKYSPTNTVKIPIYVVGQKYNNLLQWHIYPLPLSFTINIKNIILPLYIVSSTLSDFDPYFCSIKS